MQDELNEIINRPWGYYVCQNRSLNCQTKIIFVNPHQRLSLQTHEFRDEHWVVLEGVATVIKGDAKHILKVGDHIDICRQIKHALLNQTSKPLKVLEVQFGSNLSESDIVRYEDIYGRL